MYILSRIGSYYIACRRGGGAWIAPAMCIDHMEENNSEFHVCRYSLGFGPNICKHLISKILCSFGRRFWGGSIYLVWCWKTCRWITTSTSIHIAMCCMLQRLVFDIFKLHVHVPDSALLIVICNAMMARIWESSKMSLKLCMNGQWLEPKSYRYMYTLTYRLWTFTQVMCMLMNLYTNILVSLYAYMLIWCRCLVA